MPLLKLCAKCGRVIPIGNSLCDHCQLSRTDNAKQYDAHVRDKRSIKFYKSAEWERIRSYVLMRDRFCCQECKRQGIINAATEVHHIVPLRVDLSKRTDPNNLISLCHKHHMEIEKRTRRG